MKLSLYLKYPLRSFVRGGGRSVMAIFCVAVGVMALVALQLVSFMLETAFAVNARDANGGDITIRQQQGFAQSDLTYFDTLKRTGAISEYTASMWITGQLNLHDSARESNVVYIVDPKHFPLTQPPAFKEPHDGTIADLVKGNQVIVTQSFVDLYKKNLGDHFDLHVSGGSNGSWVIPVSISGIVTDSSILIQAAGRGTIIVSQDTYMLAHHGQSILYNTLFVTVADQAHIPSMIKEIQNHFPNAQFQTAQDALKQWDSNIASISIFMEIAGLMALLIGGVGIANTMQVLLSRRRIEIAMLKSTGYQRLHLYLLFGLEAGLLGLIGGAIGAGAAVGASYVIQKLLEQTLQVRIPFVFNPLMTCSGVGIGIATALIFGLLPIVQGANIRPLSIIRDLQEAGNTSSRALTIGLLGILSLLFCIMAIVILHNNILLGVIAVYAGFFLLSVMTLLFGIIIGGIARVQLPEHLYAKHFILVVVCGLLAVIGFIIQPALGWVLCFVTALLILIMVLPGSWKTMAKMALRNLGRQRMRTTTTMLALFVGIFAMSMIQVVGQNVRDELNKPRNVRFNLDVRTTGNDTRSLQDHIQNLPGLHEYRYFTVAGAIPIGINGSTTQQFLNSSNQSSHSTGGSGGQPQSGAAENASSANALQVVNQSLANIEGYDLRHSPLPATAGVQIIGRNLQASDAGSQNVVVSGDLMTLRTHPLHLADTITLESQDHIHKQTVTIVGFYTEINSAISGDAHVAEIWASDTLVKLLQPVGVERSEFLMNVTSYQVPAIIDMITRFAPNVDILDRSANNADFANKTLNNLLSVLIAVASLSLLAGVIIIANAVALAMLERRREVGILKSVGYTSKNILGVVMIENGVIGGIGALIALLLTAVVAQVVGVYIYRATFSVNGLMALGLFAGAVLLAILVAVVVAWGAVRIRPLEVLRYE